MQVWWLHHLSIKVSKGAKIRNRYNHLKHLTQDTNGKVCPYIGQYKHSDVSKQLSECHSNITCVKLTNATTTRDRVQQTKPHAVFNPQDRINTQVIYRFALAHLFSQIKSGISK